MRSTLIRITWLIIIIIMGCSKAPLPPESESNSENNGLGEVKITTVNNLGIKVDSAKIFLNGKLIGYSPVSLKSIALGVHTIRAQKQGYEVQSENITVDNNLPVNKEIMLKNLPLNTGQLLITVNQDSANTTVTTSKDELVNQTDVRELLLTLDTGCYYIRCEKTGYTLVSKAVDVKIDSITVVNIELEKIPDYNLPQLAILVPDSGKVNDPVVISWESANANRVDIDYIENPGLNGKREVTFQSTGKQYIKATAHNETEQISVVDSIYVSEVSDNPPTINLSVSPKRIYTNEVVTLSWHSTNATEVAVDVVPNPGFSGQWQEMFYSSGTVIVHAYAYGPGGEAQDADTIYVEEYTEPGPEITLYVSPKVIALNETVTISWQSNNATTVDVDFVPDAGLNGQWQTAFSTPGEIIINAYAYNSRERVHDADTIQVVDIAPPSLEFTVDQDEVVCSQPILLSWNTDGYQVIIDFGVGTRGPVGNEEIVFECPGVKEITAVAYGDNDLTTVKTVSILVQEPEQKLPQLPVLSLSVVDSVQVRHPAQIEWHSWNATRVDVDYVQSPGLSGKSEVVFESIGKRIITATAYNDAGQVTVVDTIEVVNVTVSPEDGPIFVESDTTVCACYYNLLQVVENAGEVITTVPGYYRITAGVWYEKGDEQKNESFFITIIDDRGVEINPNDANLAIYKVVVDDPGAPHFAERDAGLFYLNEGVNRIRLAHYRSISDQYPQFIVDGPPLTGRQAVRIFYFKLEYVNDYAVENLAQ